jgi:copper resistance protein D
MAMRRYVIPILCCLLLGSIAIPFLSAQPLHVPIETPDQDKSFSEFNHHLAGAFLLFIGILAFFSNSSPKLSFLGKIWPLLFILPGLYLAIMSDPDVWPMGDQSWLQALRSNPEVVQHKIYSVLLLALGVTEFQRSRGKLGDFPARWSFPALAIFGAVLLFFHEHHGGAEEMVHSMPGMERNGHMMMTESMAKIKRQHLWFSIVGLSVMLFKFLSDGSYWRRSFVPFLWPVCISILGVLLILYTE